MSRLFARLGSAFIAPPPRGAHADERPRPLPHVATGCDGPTRVAVLCRADDALVAGAAVALGLVLRARSHALVAAWGAGGIPRAPASAPARRLAATLAARGHAVSASGRLAVARLGGDPAEAAAEAMRAAAAAGEAPVVTVLAAPRDEAADDLLAAQDGIVVALGPGSDGAVAHLAVRGLAPLAVPAADLILPAAPAPVRALAASGAALLPPLRGAVDAALERVS